MLLGYMIIDQLAYKVNFRLATSISMILSDYLSNKLKILSSGLRELHDITGCKSSCTMPKFTATVQEHYVEHGMTESEVRLEKNCKLWAKVVVTDLWTPSAPDILCLLERGLLDTETVLRLWCWRLHCRYWRLHGERAYKQSWEFRILFDEFDSMQLTFGASNAMYLTWHCMHWRSAIEFIKTMS